MTNPTMKHSNDSNIMTLTGKGSVTAMPDIAVLRLGVQTTDFNLVEAQDENARISQAVLESLQLMGITDIKTHQYQINKIYEYENNIRVDKGYSVRNIIEIRMNELDQVGAAIDTAVSQGANIVDLINFEVADTDRYYLQALNLAVMDAYQKASSITDSIGIRINPIPKRITENSSTPIPYRNLAFREGAFTTPIEPGTLDIEAIVTVEYTY